MNLNPSLPHRRTLRLPEFDYAQPGAYFVTIVTQYRKPIFGQIVDGEMVLNEVGWMIKDVIDQIPEHYLGVNVELFVIMPNHVHLLFLIFDVVADPRAGVVAGPRACHANQIEDGQPRGVDPTKERLSLPVQDPRAGVVAGLCACQANQIEDGQPRGVVLTKEQLSLPEIVHRIKSFTTHRYMKGVIERGWTRFEKRLWRRNYYEHIIRNERDYLAIYEYILANPMNWEKDEEFSAS